MKYAIHTHLGWWTGCGFSDLIESAQKCHGHYEQTCKAHRMMDDGIEAKVVPATRSVLRRIQEVKSSRG